MTTQTLLQSLSNLMDRSVSRRRRSASSQQTEAMCLEAMEGRVLMSTSLPMVDAETTTRTAIVTYETAESGTSDSTYTLVETSTRDSDDQDRLATDSSSDDASDGVSPPDFSPPLVLHTSWGQVYIYG